MNESKINVRYAKALFSLCKELDQVEPLQRDVSLVDKLCRESADFMQLLANPVISVSRKKTVVQKILESHVTELGMRFFMLIIEKQRETEIPGICRNFLDMVRADRGIIPAQVTTAGKLSAETLAVIRNNIESETGKSVELNDRVNPELIGGMIIRIGDRQYDGSVSTQLKKMKTALMGK